MRKTLAVILISLCIFLCSCANAAQTERTDNLYPRIVVAKKPPEYFFNNYIGNHRNLQDALDEMVDNYNKTYDNEDLYNICEIIYFREYFKNSNAIVVIYYSKFFEEIWSDNNFNKETEKSHIYLARVLLNAMYYSENKKESIEFYDKYIATINDPDEKVSFSQAYSIDYSNDENPDHDMVAAMLERMKKFEIDYYDKVDDINKSAICSMIYQYAEMINDTETAEKYKQKTIEIIQEWSNESSQN